MNRTLTIVLLLVAFSAHAQQTAYRDFEVQQPAEPQGGLTALSQFLAVNVRKPFMAQVANIKGLVILQGVVEPDGRIAEVSLVRSLRPDCDREAMRVFTLFNAWKPAQKEGKTVRQVVTIPVPFKANELVMYENGIAIRYFNNAFQLVASPDSAVLRSEMPADTFGIPTGNLVFFKRSGKKWKREIEIKFVRVPVKNRQTLNGALFAVGHDASNGQPFGQSYVVDNQGNYYNENYFDIDQKPSLTIHRDNQGVVTYREQHSGEQSRVSSWYGNGQIKQKLIRFRNFQPGQPYEQMLVFWDSTGTQTVNEGNGSVLTKARIRSLADTSLYTILIQKGNYEKGLKNGIWTGVHADSSYWYQEAFDKGILITGKAKFHDLADTVRYAVADQQPEFKGGMQALNQFLASNMRYPEAAQRDRVQGRVLVSFVVGEDGILRDFIVVEGIHPALDREALRVTAAMNGYWKPGLQRGRSVRVRYRLPINFSLN